MKRFLLLIALILPVCLMSQIVKVTGSCTPVKENVFTIRYNIERGSLDKDVDVNTFFYIEQRIPDNVMPIGLSAGGGIYSFKDHMLTYTWYSLPRVDFIEVVYKVKVNQDQETTVLTGWYYYLVEEEKQVYKLPEVRLE
jgi:hypothetical protein